MIIVSNTTPLIAFSSLQKLDLLQQLFGKIYIAQAVYNEATIAKKAKDNLGYEISQADWICPIKIKDTLAVEVLLDELDLGESETIVLAKEINADWVLMDEKKGRRKLTQLGLQKIGTLGLLLKAKEIGLLTEIRPDIEKLNRTGFNLSEKVIFSVLQQANEL
jgi:predicted nucleic acid-binding protein